MSFRQRLSRLLKQPRGLEASCGDVQDAIRLLYTELDALRSPTMKCEFPGCGNEVRYIDEHGRLTCGVCPVKANIDSIRIADVPKLVGWARDIARAHRKNGYVELASCDIDAVSELIRIDPPAPRKLEPDCSMVAWPKHVPRRTNGGTVCDMWTGPCACGAMHYEGR